ncbi:MAG TPA: hypothetical protein VE870_10170 [Bacteroidales bacterium]|nr:hypothetical protein [Bacteroidales bacterium]
MKPHISKTGFGFLVAGNTRYDYDVLFRLSGEVKKRKKKLSKAQYGTSHIISRDEAMYVFEDGVRTLIIGSGQDGMVTLSDEAAGFFRMKNCLVNIFRTPEAADQWNKAGKGTAGLFHVTC